MRKCPFNMICPVPADCVRDIFFNIPIAFYTIKKYNRSIKRYQSLFRRHGGR